MGQSIDKANTPRLAPEDQFPHEAFQQSVQIQPPAQEGWNGVLNFTFGMASAADGIIAWGKNVQRRDQQLRDFWPTESYLAGTVASVSFRNASFDWSIKHSSPLVAKAVENMLKRAGAGDSFGWNNFINKYSCDLYTTDNGAFIEVIRDPGEDANSKFTRERAPVVGIAHLDSGQCVRTGNAEFPVVYTDRHGERHKLAWYQVIPFSEFPSPVEKMNGVGYCAVTRALRLSQIMRSVLLFKDEEVSGTNTKKIHLVGGVSRVQIEDAVKRNLENASNKGNARYIEHAVLSSLDPEKPVSAVTLDLAGLPDEFNFAEEMQWYIAGLALDFGVDYQELAPLPGGGIGGGGQSNMLHRKSSGKGPRNWMDSLVNSFTYYGVLPRGAEMIFNDKNEQEELEKQEVRKEAIEETAIAVNSRIMTPEAALKSLIRRGIYDEEDMKNIPPEWWQHALDAAENEAKGQPVGAQGGNTIAEDAKRQQTGKPNLTAGARLRKNVQNILQPWLG